MNGKRAKERRRLQEQRSRTAQAVNDALHAAVDHIQGDEQRIVIVEGGRNDDIIPVPRTNEDQELQAAREQFLKLYPDDTIKSMVRMIGRDEPEAQERQDG